MGDRHHIHSIASKFVFLAAILDAFNHKVIGWALKDSLQAGLCIEAALEKVSSQIGNGLTDGSTQFWLRGELPTPQS